LVIGLELFSNPAPGKQDNVPGGTEDFEDAGQDCSACKLEFDKCTSYPLVAPAAMAELQFYGGRLSGATPPEQPPLRMIPELGHGLAGAPPEPRASPRKPGNHNQNKSLVGPAWSSGPGVSGAAPGKLVSTPGLRHKQVCNALRIFNCCKRCSLQALKSASQSLHLQLEGYVGASQHAQLPNTQAARQTIK
jgi:hypothetical protein